jgi:hypothetical protein
MVKRWSDCSIEEMQAHVAAAVGHRWEEPRRALTIVHKAPGPHQDSCTADVDESMRWKSGTGKPSAATAGARGGAAYS